MRSRIAAFIAAALVLTLGLPAPGVQAKPAQPAPANYLAAGDSVTQGLGVPEAKSYPARLDARSRRITLAENLAVKGATVADAGAQLAAYAGANPSTAAQITKISLTVGANDVGWVDTLLFCLQAPAGAKCADLPTGTGKTVQQLTDEALGALALTLPAMLDAVGPLFPKAKFYVAGYYEIFGSKPKTCTIAPGYSISRVNKAWYNKTTHRLNWTIRAAVATANASPAGGVGRVRYVNVAAQFNGHGFCDSARSWLIGPQGLDAVAHPNERGQRAYQQAFVAKGIR